MRKERNEREMKDRKSVNSRKCTYFCHGHRIMDNFQEFVSLDIP